MISFCIRNAFLTFFAALALGLAGLWAWRSVPVDAIPDLSDNQVIVWAEWPGASPRDMELQVGSRLARELQGLPGVTSVRGMSLTGTSYVYVIFEENRDLYECRTRVLERLSQMQGSLPVGVTPRLGPDATAMGQVFAFSLQGPASVETKRNILDQIVIPALQGVAGVAEVAPAGGVVREYQIEVDPLRLRALGLSLDELMTAVQKAGRDVGAMSVEQAGVETMIRGVGFLRSVREVEDIVLRGDPMKGAGLRLGDIATIQLGGRFRQGLLADENGEQVGAIVAMRVKEDPKTVIDAVKKRLLELAPSLRNKDLEVVTFYDRSELIEQTSQTLTSTLVEAILTTALVIVAFLLHARASLVVSVSLPLGMLFTFIVMHSAGLGANIMSLAGIAIAIGVMVDFGIIMTENITQHLVDLQAKCRGEGRPMPHSPFDKEIVETLQMAAQEVTRPLITSAATTVIGFLPLFALQDQAGRLFIPLALTKTLAISGAVLFGLLLVPALCRFLLPPWQAPLKLQSILSGLAGGLGFGWFLEKGWSLPMDHGRWVLQIPGYLFAPLFAALCAFVVWRLGRERLVDAENNPTSRAIHIAYEWAYTRLQRRKGLFTAGLLLLASGGYLVGLGWESFSAPLRVGMSGLGAKMEDLRIDETLKGWFPGVNSSFLPPLDEGSLLFMPSVPALAGLGETQRVMQIQNRLIASVPEVDRIMGKLGRAETALDPAPIGMIETVVLLKPYRDWPVHEIMLPDGSTEHRPRTLAELRNVLSAVSDLPGVAPSWLQPIETRVVMLSTGIRSLLALQILGDDAEALERFAEAAEKIISTTPGAKDVQMQREGGKAYAEIRLDPAKLTRFGLRNEGVMQIVESALGGMPLAFTIEGTQRYPVRLRYYRELRDDVDELMDLQIPLMGAGGSVPLSSLVARPQILSLRFKHEDRGPDSLLHALPLAYQRSYVRLSNTEAELTLAAGDPEPEALVRALAEGWVIRRETRPAENGFTTVIGPMAIRSEGGKLTQYVLLNAEGRGEVELVRDAEARLSTALADKRLELPTGATYRWVGRYEQKLKADKTLSWIIASSMAVMIVLIYVGTRSWLVTSIIILCNGVVTTAGGFFLVWLWGAEMTTAVIVGFLVLLGVMFNDGILLGTYLQEQFKTAPKSIAELHARIFKAGLRRRRPAIMTNATTLLSLIPVLWATGRGAELMVPMVLPVVGGMLFDFASLFSVPIFYAWYWERKLARDRP